MNVDALEDRLNTETKLIDNDKNRIGNSTPKDSTRKLRSNLDLKNIREFEHMSELDKILLLNDQNHHLKHFLNDMTKNNKKIDNNRERKIDYELSKTYSKIDREKITSENKNRHFIINSSDRQHLINTKSKFVKTQLKNSNEKNQFNNQEKIFTDDKINFNKKISELKDDSFTKKKENTNKFNIINKTCIKRINSIKKNNLDNQKLQSTKILNKDIFHDESENSTSKIYSLKKNGLKKSHFYQYINEQVWEEENEAKKINKNNPNNSVLLTNLKLQEEEMNTENYEEKLKIKYQTSLDNKEKVKMEEQNYSNDKISNPLNIRNIDKKLIHEENIFHFEENEIFDGAHSIPDSNYNQRGEKENKMKKEIIVNFFGNENDNNILKNREFIRRRVVYDSLSEDEDIINRKTYFLLLNPCSNFRCFLDFLNLIIILYSIIFLPLRIIFFSEYNVFLFICEIFADSVFIIDLFLGFFTSYLDFEENLITFPDKIVENYLRTYFLPDFIAAIPFNFLFEYSNYKQTEIREKLQYSPQNFTNKKSYIFKNTDTLYQQQSNIEFIKLSSIFYENDSIYSILILNNFDKNYILLKILRIVKLFKIFTRNEFINRIKNSITSNISNLTFTIKILLYYLYFFMISHILSCIFIFLGTISYPNWIIKASLQNANFYELYLASLYFNHTTIFTVGYGDILSKSLPERIYNGLLMIVGIMLYSFALTSISNIIKIDNQKTKVYENKKEFLNNISTKYYIDRLLYDKLSRHLFHEMKADKNKILDFLNELPITLRNEMIFNMYRKIINSFNFFKECYDNDFIIQVIVTLKPTNSVKNEILVKQGDFIDEITLINMGIIQIEILEEGSERVLKRNKFDDVRKIKNENDSKHTIYDSAIESESGKYTNINKKRSNIKFDSSRSFSKVNFYLNTESEKALNNKNLNVIRLNAMQFEKIKILELRRNEHFGDSLMIDNIRSPVTLRTKSKSAELFLMNKIDVLKLYETYSKFFEKIYEKSSSNLRRIMHRYKRLKKEKLLGKIKRRKHNNLYYNDYCITDSDSNITESGNNSNIGNEEIQEKLKYDETNDNIDDINLEKENKEEARKIQGNMTKNKNNKKYENDQTLYNGKEVLKKEVKNNYYNVNEVNKFNQENENEFDRMKSYEKIGKSKFSYLDKITKSDFINKIIKDENKENISLKTNTQKNQFLSRIKSANSIDSNMLLEKKTKEKKENNLFRRDFIDMSNLSLHQINHSPRTRILHDIENNRKNKELIDNLKKQINYDTKLKEEILNGPNFEDCFYEGENERNIIPYVSPVESISLKKNDTTIKINKIQVKKYQNNPKTKRDNCFRNENNSSFDLKFSKFTSRNLSVNSSNRLEPENSMKNFTFIPDEISSSRCDFKIKNNFINCILPEKFVSRNKSVSKEKIFRGSFIQDSHLNSLKDRSEFLHNREFFELESDKSKLFNSIHNKIRKFQQINKHGNKRNYYHNFSAKNKKLKKKYSISKSNYKAESEKDKEKILIHKLNRSNDLLKTGKNNHSEYSVNIEYDQNIRNIITPNIFNNDYDKKLIDNHPNNLNFNINYLNLNLKKVNYIDNHKIRQKKCDSINSSENLEKKNDIVKFKNKSDSFDGTSEDQEIPLCSRCKNFIIGRAEKLKIKKFNFHDDNYKVENVSSMTIMSTDESDNVNYIQKRRIKFLNNQSKLKNMKSHSDSSNSIKTKGEKNKKITPKIFKEILQKEIAETINLSRFPDKYMGERKKNQTSSKRSSYSMKNNLKGSMNISSNIINMINNKIGMIKMQTIKSLNKLNDFEENENQQEKIFKKISSDEIASNLLMKLHKRDDMGSKSPYEKVNRGKTLKESSINILQFPIEKYQNFQESPDYIINKLRNRNYLIKKNNYFSCGNDRNIINAGKNSLKKKDFSEKNSIKNYSRISISDPSFLLKSMLINSNNMMDKTKLSLHKINRKKKEDKLSIKHNSLINSNNKIGEKKQNKFELDKIFSISNESSSDDSSKISKKIMMNYKKKYLDVNLNSNKNDCKSPSNLKTKRTEIKTYFNFQNSNFLNKKKMVVHHKNIYHLNTKLEKIIGMLNI